MGLSTFDAISLRLSGRGKGAENKPSPFFDAMKSGMQWGKLTDDDLDQISGKRDQLEGKIQERYGIEKDRVRRDVDDWYGRQSW